MVNVSGAGVVKVLKEIFMKYCFGCDGQFGAEDGIASSRSLSYGRLQRDIEGLPSDLRIIRAFYESQVKSYSSSHPSSMPHALPRGTNQPQLTTIHRKIYPKKSKTYRIANSRRGFPRQ